MHADWKTAKENEKDLDVDQYVTPVSFLGQSEIEKKKKKIVLIS